MSDILLDSSPAYSPDQAQSIFKPDSPLPQQEQAPSRTQELADKPNVKPQEAKPENAALESAGKKKSALDKVGGIKKPEIPKEEVKVEEPAKTVVKNDKEENWAFMRKKVEDAEKELSTVKPELERLKPEYETTKAELAKMKALGLTETERNEFKLYREMHAVEAVKNSKDFKEKIMGPIQAKIGKIKSVSSNAKLQPQQASALLDACDIEDEFQRNKAIRSIVRGEDLEPEDYQALADSAISAARDLQETLYPKHDEALGRAEEVQLAARAREQQQGQQATQKQQQEDKRAHEEVWNILSTDKLKLVLDEQDLSIDGITMADAMKGAEAAASPQDRAFEVQAAAALPFIVEYANRALAKVAALEQANKIRNGVVPSRRDGATKEQKIGEKPITAEEAFGRH